MQTQQTIPTFAQALNDLRVAKKHQEHTRAAYDKRLAYVSDWLQLRVTDITKTQVIARHNQITTKNGAAIANLVFRHVRAVLNFAMHYYDKPDGEPILARNPVKILAVTGSWNRITPRKTHIVNSLTPWLRTVLSLESITRDYFLFLLLSGCRKSEAMELRWANVDLENGTATIKDTKNGDDHCVVFSDLLQAMFEDRHANRTRSPFVFPGAFANKRMSGASKTYERVSRISGVPFTPHSLRRSFSTIADALDVPHYTLKRLLNHRSGGSDVTAGYVVRLPDRYKEPMQKITDEVFRRAKISKEGAIALYTNRSLTNDAARTTNQLVLVQDCKVSTL
jgi:integrase